MKNALKGRRKSEKTQSIKYILWGIWKNISKARKNQIILLFIFMLLSGLAELFSLAAVIPFMTVLTSPELTRRARAASIIPTSARTVVVNMTTPSRILRLTTSSFKYQCRQTT